MNPSSLLPFVVLRLVLILMGRASLIDGLPTSDDSLDKRGGSSYWVANIQRQGVSAFGDANYQVYRDVTSFGAKGDGTSDDTAAINNAISSGNRCGQGCNSSTTTPDLVYFPPGTYLISKPIVQLYFTQFVGDAISPPTIKAAPGFSGIALIDSDPYDNSGNNWYTNQNNFYRQIRNFVIDLTALPPTSGAGIHWQVAQATSLQNIVFNMVKGGNGNKQQGIFMDNGSGGFMSDLVFNGGSIGAFLGNQQFTIRNLTFNGCDTAIDMNWGWQFSFKSITINDCQLGINMSTSPQNQTVGSILLSDSSISGTPVGINTAFTQNSMPNTAGTLLLDNVDFSGCPTAVQGVSGNTILAGGSRVASWGQGHRYTGSTGTRVQDNLTAPSKPAGLLDGSGKVYERGKPQYKNVPATSFVSVKSKGAKGDGQTDDTAAIQNAMNSITPGQVLYFDYGAYIISSTIKVPKNINITGEIWPILMAKGEAFQDQTKLTPMLQVGQPGDSGNVEMSDLVFATVGPQLGAVLVEWNVAGSSQGSAGMWDCHWRIGGFAGTNLQADKCTKNPSQIAPANLECGGAGMDLHITSSGSAYIENAWAWTSDHELDQAPNNQINIFTGRGILIESQQPTWLYGTASEHSVLYNYGFLNAKNVYLSMIQTETPYFQTNPDATAPFQVQGNIADPTFDVCAPNDPICKKSWGLKIMDSQDILIYGAGLYSFFNNWDEDCAASNNCQTNMVHIQNSTNTPIYGLSTKAAVNMVTLNGSPQALDADNRNTFCAALLEYSGS